MLAFAQQRPLVTEDPETVGEGLVLVEFGADVTKGVEFPASGLEGNFARFPLYGVSVGIGSRAEIQFDGGLYNRLSITDRRAAPLSSVVETSGDVTSSIEDMVIGAKVRLVTETPGRPALGFRFATRLPNASNESGIGLDTFDFYASALVAKTIQSVRLVGNVGMGILADPTRGDRQNDVLTYGVSLARALTEAVEVVAEINGRESVREGTPPPGTESRGTIRFGGRYTIGAWRADAALLIGVTSQDGSVGLAGGATYVFDWFQAP